LNQLRYIIIGISIILIGFLVWYFKSVVAYVLLSAVISIIGHPIVEFLGKIKIWKFTFPKSVCAGFTLILFWFLFIIFFRIFVPLLLNQADELSNIDFKALLESLKEPTRHFQNILWQTHIKAIQEFSFENYAVNKISSLVNTSQITSLFTFSMSMLGDLLIAMFSISFITFFFLRNDTLFTNIILSVTHEKYSHEVKRIILASSKLLKRYFIGITLQSLIITILFTIGLTLIGLKFSLAVIIAFLAGLFNIIPYIGPLIAGLTAIILSIITNFHLNFYTQLVPLMGYIVVVFICVRLIDDFFIQPLVYSNSVNAHPLEIFIVISLAGNLAGIVGMIIAIPSYTVIRVIAREFFSNFRLVRKITEKMDG